MRILFTFFELLGWGGIVADLEYKARGLTEAGHQVDIVFLRDTDRDPYIRRDTEQKGSYPSFFEGATVHTEAGYYGIPVVSYGSKKRLDKWRKRTEKYDLIIHEIPGPNPLRSGSRDDQFWWRNLYRKVDTPQIISAHDANFRDLYPHLIYVAEFIKGISCTNQAGYAALSWFPAPRAFVGAPHPIMDWDSQPTWKERNKQAICAHVWKGWKHMDMAVRAYPYLESEMIMAGDGIERRYMTAPKKFKPRYEGIWKKATDAGMDYKGMLTEKQLNKHYRRSRVMLDTSWSKKFMGLGCHFNRSIIEAYNNGCVPICVHENMNEEGFQLAMFKAGKTHFEISNTATPKEIAAAVDHAVNIKTSEAEEMLYNGRKVLKRFFDYRKTSLEYIKLAQGKPAGVYPVLETGKLNKHITAKAEKYLEDLEVHFKNRGKKKAKKRKAQDD